MRGSMFLALTLAVTSFAVTSFAGADDTALNKLNELRQRKKDLANRHRAAIFIINETPVAGVENHLREEAVILFSSKGHEIVNHPDHAGIVAAHAKTPFTAEELARLAGELEVETVAVGYVKDYRAKKDIGLPLPTMSVRTEARVKMDGLVYKRSSGQIVWQESASRVNRQFVGGGLMSRDHVRRRTGEGVVDKLFSSYFAKRG